MKKLDISIVPVQTGSTYPAPFDLPCSAQSSQRLAHHAGLTAFGVNLTVIEAGAQYLLTGVAHQCQLALHDPDELVVVEGELTLVSDAGEEILRAGDCAAF